MSQQLPDDFPIDPVTTSGTALADILNRQNQALNSSNAGATPPPSTFPGMVWLDTSTSPAVLRIRNAANTGWGTIPVSDATGGGAPYLLPDGSVAAPALAFASETGLGWYRSGANVMSLAAGGARQFDIQLNTANAPQLVLWPRAAGQSALRLFANPLGNANLTGLNITSTQTQVQLAAFGANGTTQRTPLNFSGSSYGWYESGEPMTYANNSLSVPRQVSVGGSMGMRWDGANGNFLMMHSSPVDWSWQFDRTSGNLSWIRPGTTADFTLHSDGGVSSNGGSIVTGNGNLNTGNGGVWCAAGMSLAWDGGNANFLSMGASGAEWRWQWVRNTGALNWFRASGSPTTQFNPNGDFIGGRDIYTDSAGGMAMIGHNSTGGNPQIRFTSDGWRLQWGGGQLNYLPAGGGGASWWSDGAGNFNTATQGWKPGGGSWGSISDERVKENVRNYEHGLAEVLRLRPRIFNYKADTNVPGAKDFIGLVAQEAMAPMPEMVTVSAGSMGSMKYDDMHQLDTTALPFALVNAVKTLNDRLTQLENAA